MKLILSLILLCSVTSAFAWPKKSQGSPIIKCSSNLKDQNLSKLRFEFSFFEKSNVAVFVNGERVSRDIKKNDNLLYIEFFAPTHKIIKLNLVFNLEEVEYYSDRAVINQRGPEYHRLTDFFTLLGNYKTRDDLRNSNYPSSTTLELLCMMKLNK